MNIIKRGLRKFLKCSRPKDLNWHDKQSAEIDFWEKIISKYIAWYQGDLPTLYEKPSPSEDIKIKNYDLKQNAIKTWQRVAGRKYLSALQVDEDHFHGMSLLDVGCGPIPHLLAFRHCRRFGLDELIHRYKLIGFPLDDYSSDITYLSGKAEAIPVKDNSFDAVISVNAIDHVDDFYKAAKEIRRVLRPNGILRMQAHYHKSTTCEPWALSDKILLDNFGQLGIKKVTEKEIESTPGEKLVVWTTLC